MSTQIEEIVLRMKLDAAQAEISAQNMLSRERVHAREYVGFWEGALAKREAAEIATAESIAVKTLAIERDKNAKSLAMARATAAEKAAANQAWIEEQAAQAAIARGSGGYGSIKKDEERGSHLVHDAEVTLDIAGGAGGAYAGFKAVRGGAKAAVHGGPFNETMVLVREAARGAYNRMVSSFLRLLSLMGVTAATILSSIPIVGASAGAFFFLHGRSKQLGEMQGHYGTDVEMIKVREKMAADLSKEIAKLNNGGLLNASQNEQIQNLFAQGSFRGLQGIRNILKPILPEGFGTKIKTKDEQIHDADELAAHEQKALDELANKKRDEFNLSQAIADKSREISLLSAQMVGMDQKSVEWHEAKARLLGYQVELQKDLTQQAEEQKKQAQETAEWKKWSAEAGVTFMKDQIHEGMDEAEFPTIKELATKTYTDWLDGGVVVGRGRNRRKTKGLFDLGDGGGPFAGAAQDYLLAQKAQIWDRANGFGWDANIEQRHMQEDRDYLVKSGAASPEMLLTKIEEGTAKLPEIYEAMVRSGVLIKIPDDPN